MTMDRETLRRRIAALLAKTVANGCTEDEAVAAAGVAARLMREHGISTNELQMVLQWVSTRTRGRSPRDALWKRIADCTNTATLIDALDAGDGVRRVFVGREPGPDIAGYLYVVCDRAIDRAIRGFKQTPAYKRRRTRESRRQAVYEFTVGMVGRMILTLKELFAATASASEREIATQEMLDRYPDLRPIKMPIRPVRNGAALSAGYAAGADVNLSHGVNGGAAPALIGGGV